MYEPAFNSVLVEIDDKDAQWSPGNDESMLGKSYSKGTVIKPGSLYSVPDHPLAEHLLKQISDLRGKQIMWNEGVEAGTTFEHEDKLYGFIYWWDIRGVLNGG